MFIQAQIKETPKLRVTGLCVENSPVTSEFPAQMASNAENVSIWWRHHDSDSNQMTKMDCNNQEKELPPQSSLLKQSLEMPYLEWFMQMFVYSAT